MQPKLIELRPDRNLLNSTFEGYKLSLEPIDYFHTILTSAVDRKLPDLNQYSLLHAKLFGLHNHLTGENNSVYFVDKNWKIWKYSFDASRQKLQGNIVWEIATKNTEPGAYNVSLKLLKDFAVLADGVGSLFLLNRPLNGDHWSLLFEDLIGDGKNFVINDALLRDKQLDLLLLTVEVENNSTFSKLIWLTLKKVDEKWCTQVNPHEYKINSPIQYAQFEESGEAIYIVSETETGGGRIDPEQIVVKNIKYKWTQNKEEIIIKCPLNGVEKNNISIDPKIGTLEVKIKDELILSGNLYQRIEPELTTWTMENEILELCLRKSECGLMWPEVVEGDQYGELVLNSCIVEEVGERSEHLTSESEVSPAAGTTFNSQQVEECDFEFDKLSYFERITPTHEVTHKINLGSHQILCNVNLNLNKPPAFGIRSDVDVLIWQPTFLEQNGFEMIHQGSLFAMGYIQASKQQKKYFVVAPDLSYSAICESTKHLFIYRQKKAVSSGELRNRLTGERIGTIAEQQVFNVTPNTEIFGIYATNSFLFLLGENFLTLLQF